MAYVVVDQLSRTTSRLLLNRPKALNALSLDMVKLMRREVQSFVDADPQTARILLFQGTVRRGAAMSPAAAMRVCLE